MQSINKLIDLHRLSGLKITPQRLAIFNVLNENKSHPSAEDVYKEILKDFPTISFTTVYKTLEVLVDMGEVVLLAIDPERNHYDPDTSLHSHVMCRSCNRIEDIHYDFEKYIVLPADIKNQFRIDRFILDFYGECSTCSDKSIKLA